MKIGTMTTESRTNYETLLNKLDRFTRKYYTNQMIRGGLYWLAAVTLAFLLFNILEYNFYFGRGTRKVLFFSFTAGATLSLGFWVVLPALSLLKLGKRISHEQAAAIIGEHFDDVKDKLLNILQLKRQVENSTSPGLVFASIQQKTEEMQPIPFRRAIDLRQNRRYLKYAVPPLLILLVLLIAAPTVIRDSTARIIRNNEHFQRAAPFSFNVVSEDDLVVEQYKDFLLEVEVEGSVIPNEVFISIGEYQYRLKKESTSQFTYRFKNVLDNTTFNIFAGPVISRNFELEVLRKPNMVSFEVALDYPGYTGQKDETLTDIGDLVVPAGTKITWDLNTTNTHNIDIRLARNERVQIDKRADNDFTITTSVYKDMFYTLFLSNDKLASADSVRYSINVIPDLYPKIQAEQIKDSLDDRLVYFVGSVGDDYGIRKLNFNYRITPEEATADGEMAIVPMVIKNNRQFQFSHMFDINELELKPGDQLTYFFEVFDNDGVNGSKSTKSTILTYKKPTIDEFEKNEEKNNDAIKQGLKDALKESQKLQQDMKELREKLLQEKSLEWQNKKELENFMKRQTELQQQMHQAQQLYEENLHNQQEYSAPTPEQMEKQERMQELFEELMDQDMMEYFGEMLEQMEKQEALEMLEMSELDEEQLQKELDRLMELFKQMELEQELNQQAQKLNELAQREEELSERTEEAAETEEEHRDDESLEGEDNNSQESPEGENEQENSEVSEESEGEEESGKEQNESQSDSGQQQEEGQSEQQQLQQEQQEIQQEFEEFRKEMEKIQQKNDELERPRNMDGAQDQMNKIEQDMQNSQQQMQQQQNKKAARSQKRAAERMREMAQQMGQQMQQGQMQQMQEDLGSLRQLLENLITLSFDQEDVIDNLNRTSVNTPRYTELVQDQFRIKDDFKVVEDTLQALSKRVIQIESFVTEKVTDIKANLGESLDQLEERKKAVAADHQQRAMTNINDLALMLSEVMNQMQQQMSQMMPGMQMCDSPGDAPGQQKGRMPIDKITEGQQQLNEDMKEMGRRMQEGGKASSEDFARMAARQAALRKALRERAQELQQQGQGDEQIQNTVQQMDKIETELVNKQLTNEMMKRQEEILTRLLEAEQAEREREMDNKREAQTADQIDRQLPPSLRQYLKNREAEIESFETVSPALRPYYKFLVEEYYDALKKQQ